MRDHWEMIQSRDSGALVISLVSFDTLQFIFIYLFIYFLIRNIFLVDGAS